MCSGTHFGSSSLQGTQSFYGLFSVLKEVKLADKWNVLLETHQSICWWYRRRCVLFSLLMMAFLYNWIIIRNWMVQLWFLPTHFIRVVESWTCLFYSLLYISHRITDYWWCSYLYRSSDEFFLNESYSSVFTRGAVKDIRHSYIICFNSSSLPPWSGSGLILCIFSYPGGVGWGGMGRFSFLIHVCLQK